jgi:hypothetical protein
MIYESTMYSDLADESGTHSCFLLDQHMGVEPKYITYPDVDFLSFKSPSQSEFKTFVVCLRDWGSA